MKKKYLKIIEMIAYTEEVVEEEEAAASVENYNMIHLTLLPHKDFHEELQKEGIHAE